MRCMNCNGDVPPQWVSAIQKNECPGCGEAIMDESSKELLDELRSAMEEMPNDPEGLAGWLLSNYKLRKIGDAEPTDFHRARPARPEQIPHGLKIANNPKSVFLQRAGMGREMSRRENLATLAHQINEAGDDDGTVSIDMEQVDEFSGLDDYERVALLQSQQAQGSSARHALHNNSIVIEGDGAPPTSVEQEMIAQALGQKMPAAGADDLPPALQADRYKRLKTQQDVAAGGMVGKIRR